MFGAGGTESVVGILEAGGAGGASLVARVGKPRRRAAMKVD
jgi:hypothetical protein